MSTSASSTAISGLSYYGKFRSTIGLVFAVIFFFILLGAGIYIIVDDPVIDDKQGKPLPKSWDPWIGSGLIAMGVLSLVMAYVFYHIAHTSKGGAAVVGGIEAIGDISNLIRR